MFCPIFQNYEAALRGLRIQVWPVNLTPPADPVRGADGRDAGERLPTKTGQGGSIRQLACRRQDAATLGDFVQE